MNSSSYYNDMIKKQIESIPNDSNIILSNDDFNALTKFIQDVLEEFWNDHINGTAQMNNEEEEKVIKVAIKVFMEQKQNNMRSNNSEMVEHNQMTMDTVQSHSISRWKDPNVGVGNIIETNTVNDTDQQVDKIGRDNKNNESERDNSRNSISLIATDTSCNINNDFHQSMNIESHSNDGRDVGANVNVNVGNVLETIDLQADDINVISNRARRDFSNVSKCECGLRFLNFKFLFYHRRDQCKLWVGHRNILTDSPFCKLPNKSSYISTGLNSSNNIGTRGRLPKFDDDDDDDDDDIVIGIKRSFKSLSNIPHKTQLSRSLSGY